MDKHKIVNLTFALSVAVFFAALVFPSSCANTTESPSGGDKDSIPPVIVGLTPLPGSVNVPVDCRIAITFDEYVTVKDAYSIVLSPPQKKRPQYKMRNKTLIVYFDEPLRDSTTYTLDLTNAIADNNEGNMFPGFTLYFSTGPSMDSMAVTGTVLDCNTLNPVKGATVMLYKDHRDSAVFNSLPDAIMKTDDWGYFAIRNIKDTLYRLYAIVDQANDNMYDSENDKIAFSDSLVKPVLVATDSLKELKKYDMEDTLHCMERISEYELRMFKSRPNTQMIMNYERMDDRSAYLTFNASDAMIDSLWIGGLPSDRIITQFNIERDSLELWVNDRRPAPDTLHVFVDYMKSDSSGVLEPFVEHLRLANPNAKSYSKSSRRNLKHEDTIAVVTVTATSDMVEQNGFEMVFNYPLIYEHFDSVTLKSVNPRQQESFMKFNVSRDSTNLRKYRLMPTEQLRTGYEYTLKVPERMFRDINGFYNDSTQVSVKLPQDDKLSSITVKLSNVGHKYIVDLLNEKRDKTLRSYVVESDCELLFPYLQKGKYSVRITEDINKNGIVDAGNFLSHKQPEKVKLYKLKDGTFLLDLQEGTDLIQTIDVSALFKD